MNELQDALLQAFQVWTDNQNSLLRFDRTVLCKVHSIDNLDTGAYYVRYEGNIFLAYTNDLNKTYSVNENVYVMIPEGDFSQKKFILRSAKNSSITAAELMRLQNSILEVSPDMNDLYGGNLYDGTTRRGVIAGATQAGAAGGEYYIYQGSDQFSPNDYHGLFQQYANNYEYILIKASFMTNLFTQYTDGNYGLKIEFYAKENNVVSFTLDVTNFNGSYYRFSTPAEQYIVVKTQKNYLQGLKSIKLFERFPAYDVRSSADLGTRNYNTTVANVFVENVSIKFVDYIDLSSQEYYLMISAPKGIAFARNISSLDLVGQLIYKGEKVTDNCEWQWYQRDVSIESGATGYNKEVGVGWSPIAAGGTSQTLSLLRSAVPHAQSYKVLLTYKDDIVLTKEIKVYNHTSPYDFEIQQITQGGIIYLTLSDTSLNGEWWVTYPDGRYEHFADGPAVEIVDMLQYSNLVFHCKVSDGSTYLDTLDFTIQNSDSEDDVTIAYDGEDTFRYDANGDIAWEDTEKERTLQVNLTWKEGYGAFYRVEWLAPDGRVLTPGAAAIHPSNSMIEDLRVDNYAILHYHIKQKYKINYNNNTITIRIITGNGRIYAFKKEILFLKDGDQGTNGTTYVAAIRPCSRDGVKVSDYQNMVLTYNNGWTRNNLPLRCYVYRDGDLINDNRNYNITYKWTGINISLVDGNGNPVSSLSGTEAPSQVYASGTSVISASADSVNLQFYVKCQVDISDRLNSRTVSIYVSYPIDVVVGGLVSSQIDLDIPSYIKYNTSGTIPSFYSGNISFKYYNREYSSQIDSLNTSLLQIDGPREGAYYLKPASSFIFEKTVDNESEIAVIKCRYNNNQYVLHSIVMYLDTYGNEAINGWDGTHLLVDNNQEYIFAPQIGAGQKDSANRFSGVVMGKDSVQTKTGLYGYYNGVNTFGLMENGIAFFGSRANGGQIIVDGTTAKIGGGDAIVTTGSTGTSRLVNPTSNGMLITLAKSADSAAATTNAIVIGNTDTFRVAYNGVVYATGANISGTIYARTGHIGASSERASDGWKIDTYMLSSDNKQVGMYAGREDGYSVAGYNSSDQGYIRFWAGGSPNTSARFYVSSTGYMKATNAYISGELHSSKGEIGGWTLSSSSLSNSSGSIVLGTGGINIGNGEFTVSTGGHLHANSATIQGSITATYLKSENGTIGGWNIGTSSLSGGSTILSSSDGITTNNLTIRDTQNSVNGTIGAVQSWNGDYYVLGVRGNAGQSVAIEAGGTGAAYVRAQYNGDAGIQGGGYTLHISNSGIHCNVPAAKWKNSGMYATFA